MCHPSPENSQRISATSEGTSSDCDVTCDVTESEPSEPRHVVSPTATDWSHGSPELERGLE
jgi:hypothetical protein